MPVCRFRPRAVLDLDSIGLFIAQDDPDAALRLIDQLETTCQDMAEFPYMGTARPDLAHELRMFPAGNYLIFYQPVEGGIDVVRILHASQDISGRLFEDR